MLLDGAEQRDHLDGLPEAHLIGEDAAALHAPHEPQPVEADELVILEQHARRAAQQLRLLQQATAAAARPIDRTGHVAGFIARRGKSALARDVGEGGLDASRLGLTR